MALSIGITGLSQSGKSTLFKSLTCLSESDVSGRKQPLARAAVPDERLQRLSDIFKPKKTTPATVDFLDMPGGGTLKFRVLDLKETVRKEEAQNIYEIIQ